MTSRNYPARPIVCVGAVVWQGEKVLLIRRGNPPFQGRWSIPGGAQNTGETITEAARRELAEETGISAEIGDVVAVIDSIHRDPQGAVEYHYTLVDVNAEWTSGEAVPGDDAAAVAWARLDQLDAFELWHETNAVIRKAALLRGSAIS